MMSRTPERDLTMKTSSILSLLCSAAAAALVAVSAASAAAAPEPYIPVISKGFQHQF